MQLFRDFRKRKEIMSNFANRNEGRTGTETTTNYSNYTKEMTVINVINHAERGD